jgi:23S rRNA pseudouridine2457 synthase
MREAKQKPEPKQPLSYLLLYKPYGVICQFSPSGGKVTLAAFGPFPPDVYPAGRLDTDSEGLLLLTNDGALQHVLLEPKYRHPRTYLAQVEGAPDETALARLREGVVIEGTRTLPADAELAGEEPDLPPRAVPIRFRKNIPTSWVRLTLREGRNRQVRKMTAAVGHPTLRLVRTAIGPLTLRGLAPGESRALTAAETAALRKLLLS